jgi:hypothetical protein
MHQQSRVRTLLKKLQGSTATLQEIQTITDIDPLVVRAALVNLQKEGDVYFTGKEYGLVEFESKIKQKGSCPLAGGKTNEHETEIAGSGGINANDELLSVRTKTGWQYKSFEDIENHLIHVHADNAKQAETLAREPSKSQQFSAALSLLDIGRVNNLNAARIMWPETVFTCQALIKKARTILVDVYSQLQKA